MVRTRCVSRGFTLIELIVALALGAVAAATVTLVLSNATRSRDAIRGRVEAFSRAQAAANAIATDLTNLVRDSDLYFARVVIESGEGSAQLPLSNSTSGNLGAERDELLMLSIITTPSRNTDEQPESDEAEVQYRVVDGSSPSPSPRLWRRVDAGPDDVHEGGGVSSPIVEGVVSLSVQASDGEGWYDDWDSDFDGMPHMVRIVVTATSASGGYLKTVRRVIAVDRPPIVGGSIAAEEESDAASADGSSSTSGSSSAPSTTGGSNSAGGTGNTGGNRGGAGGGGTPR